VSGDDSPHCPGCGFTVGQWAELTALLGVPAGWPDERVGNALLAMLDADRVLAAELDYLSTALRVGWARWAIEDLPADGTPAARRQRGPRP
jgi:hypothetical protein